MYVRILYQANIDNELGAVEQVSHKLNRQKAEQKNHRDKNKKGHRSWNIIRHRNVMNNSSLRIIFLNSLTRFIPRK